MTTPLQPELQEKRRSYRPPSGMPIPREGGRLKALASSVAAHSLLLLFLLVGSAQTGVTPLFLEPSLGAGGSDKPAGGGGGGTRGTGGSPRRERLDYVQYVPPAAVTVQAPTAQPVKEKEEVKPTPQLPVPEPLEIKKPEVVIPPPVVVTPTIGVASLGSIDSTASGRGGGSGNDGTSGNGPGSGGGIGSGIGTGRGSGVGPGTGGGPGTTYAPTPIAVPIPPTPPDRLRPYEMKAEFDVDPSGNVIAFKFNETRDRGFNKKLSDLLKTVKFRPAVDSLGRPIRATAVITFNM